MTLVQLLAILGLKEKYYSTECSSKHWVETKDNEYIVRIYESTEYCRIISLIHTTPNTPQKMNHLIKLIMLSDEASGI